MPTDRRSFIRQLSAGAGIISIPSVLQSLDILDQKIKIDGPVRVSGLKKPVAIAMWDYSWILRHHRYGEFENWDKVLEELAERGYNSIRIDAMPQFVAADSCGKVEQKFRNIKDGWTPSLWGNDYTMSFRP